MAFYFLFYLNLTFTENHFELKQKSFNTVADPFLCEYNLPMCFFFLSSRFLIFSQFFNLHSFAHSPFPLSFFPLSLSLSFSFQSCDYNITIINKLQHIMYFFFGHSCFFFCVVMIADFHIIIIMCRVCSFRLQTEIGSDANP